MMYYISGLFHRTIVQSGSALNFWALKHELEARDLGQEMARRLGCENNDSMLTCLRDVEFTRAPSISQQLKVCTFTLKNIKDYK